MKLEEALQEADRVMKSPYFHPTITKEAMGCILNELESVTKRLAQILPNGGFVVENKNSMHPTIENDKP